MIALASSRILELGATVMEEWPTIRSEPLSPEQPPFVNRESHVSTAYRSVARELGRVDKLRGVTEPLKTYELQRVD